MIVAKEISYEILRFAQDDAIGAILPELVCSFQYIVASRRLHVAASNLI